MTSAKDCRCFFSWLNPRIERGWLLGQRLLWGDFSRKHGAAEPFCAICAGHDPQKGTFSFVPFFRAAL